MHIKNAWYVGATTDEVTSKPLGRRVCNQPLVFYRDSQGGIQALEDFCPHRGAPLSLGFVEGDKLVCGYHGLKIASDGKPDSMPGQNVKNFPCVKAIPSVEYGGFVWIWPGDPEQATKEALPSLPWADSEDWTYGGGLFHIKCDYRLMIDNLMDLTHETYVHADSIGQKEIDEAAVKSRVDGDTAITERYIDGVSAPPFWQMALRANDLADDVAVDRWQICRFSPPSHVLIEVGVAHAGHGGYSAPAQHKAGSVVVDFITPETDGTIWYFWGMARTFKPQDAELTESIKQGQGKIFTEDLEMLEQQQANLEHYPDRRLLKLNIDAGGVLSRRIIDRLIKAEQNASAD